MPDVNTETAFKWPRGLSTQQRILQNCANLIGIQAGEVMGDRSMGVDPRVLDLPYGGNAALLQGMIIELIEEREDRAKVTAVEVSQDGGDVNIKAVISLA